jgi:hypothetical protein
MEPQLGDGTGRWANEVAEARVHRRFLAVRVAIAVVVLAVLVAAWRNPVIVGSGGERVTALVGWREYAILGISATFVLWGVVKAVHGRRREPRDP